ncbi:MAG: sensor histidine kinase [Acidimicrobiales bacterium]
MPASPGRVGRLTGTIRFRVTALATLAVLAVLVVAGIGLVAAQRRLLVESLDQSLDERVDGLEELIESDDLPEIIPSLLDDDDITQVVTADGEVIAASTNIENAPPIAEPSDGDAAAPRTVDGLAPDEGSFRLLSDTVDEPDRDLTVHVAANLDDIEESIRILTTSLLVAVPSVAALLAVLVWWLVGRTLRPVETIRAQVADIGGSDLHRRVPSPQGDDEIARLARTMNGMLDRLEDAARRQQRFVADASHELRSPLTRIRTELEVDLAHPATADADATHRSALAETAGLQRLVDDLLQLARSDDRAAPRRHETVDLDDIVLRQVRRLRTGDRVVVDASAVTSAQVVGDPDQLTRAVGNVVDNAARHATTTVTVTLREQGGDAVLAVADDGPGIPADQRDRIFERFTRLDDARTAGAGGTGLGLAIARSIVDRHGGSIEVDPEHSPGARFVVRLPVA